MLLHVIVCSTSIVHSYYKHLSRVNMEPWSNIVITDCVGGTLTMVTLCKIKFKIQLATITKMWLLLLVLYYKGN